MSANITRTVVTALVLVLVAGMVSGCYIGGNGLTGVTWRATAVWDKVPGVGKTLAPEDIGRYEITFAEDGTASVKADCNMVTATYATTPTRGLTIEAGASTMAMCPEDSLATQFLGLLSAATSYSILAGKLTMYIGNEGTMEFIGVE
jgi:heat shock protein HslJ